MAKVVLAEQPYSVLQNDNVTPIRICVSAAEKRAAAVKEYDLLDKAGIIASSAQAGKAFYTDFKIWQITSASRWHLFQAPHQTSGPRV
eukprot:64212-Pyramimonas_sp.AAC.1